MADQNTTRLSHRSSSLHTQLALAEVLLRTQRDLRSCGLTQRQYDLLLALKVQPRHQPFDLRSLATRLALRPTLVSSALRELRDRRLIQPCRFFRDQSVAPPQLSRRGEALLRQLTRKECHRWDTLGPAVLKSLRQALRQESRHARQTNPMR